MSGKKWQNAQGKELEKRLSNSYDAGYYDGFVEGVTSTHEIWVKIAERTKGIGPKIQKALIETAKIVMAERQDKKFGKPSEDLADVREALRS